MNGPIRLRCSAATAAILCARRIDLLCLVRLHPDTLRRCIVFKDQDGRFHLWPLIAEAQPG